MRQRRESGFGYLEVLVATLLVALALVPAMDSFEAGANALRGAEEQTLVHHHLASKLEEVLALRFDLLEAEATAVGSPTTPTGFSDPVASPRRRRVYLAHYDGDDADGDGDPFTGTDPGLVWVRVDLEASSLSLETLTVDE